MKLSQKINMLFIIFSLCLAGVRFLDYTLTQSRTIQESLLQSVFLIPLASAILFLLFQFRFPKLRRGMQVLYLFLLGSVVLLHASDQVFGFMFALAGLYLAYKYGYLEKYALPKLGMFTITTFTLLVFDSDFTVWGASIVGVLFVLQFYTILFVGEQELFKRMKSQQQRIDSAVEHIQGEQVNLKEIGFTERELEIGKLLLEVKGPDKELAWILGISSNTMRNHLKSMRMKTHTLSKQQLIDAMRWYYYSREVKKDVVEELKDT